MISSPSPSPPAKTPPPVAGAALSKNPRLEKRRMQESPLRSLPPRSCRRCLRPSPSSPHFNTLRQFSEQEKKEKKIPTTSSTVDHGCARHRLPHRRSRCDRPSRPEPHLCRRCPLLPAHRRRPASHPRSPIRPHLSPRLLSSLMCAICYSNPPEEPPTASSEFRSFIACCLQKDPARRLTALQLLQHSASLTLISSTSSPSSDLPEPLAVATILAAPPPNSPLPLSPHETQDSPWVSTGKMRKKKKKRGRKEK